MIKPLFSILIGIAVMIASPVYGATYDVSGVYESKISGGRYKTIYNKSRTPELTLTQEGNNIKGTYSGKNGHVGGDIEGVVDGTSIEYKWYSRTGGSGTGIWTIDPESNTISGTWQSHFQGKGQWNLKPKDKLVFSQTPAKVAQPSNSSEIYQVSSGSGFAVTERGHIVTNNHVIQGCAQVDIHSKGEAIPAKLLFSDPINDLAVLQADFIPDKVFSISRRNPSVLQEIYVAGYPFGAELSTSIKVTKGIVSSLAGLGNNISNIQIDAALQPGNSGGPIFDDKGNVIAVAVAKLDLRKVIENWGVIPENTNFGIKSGVVVNLLESNGIEIKEASPDIMTTADLGKIMTGATYHLSCWMTLAQIKAMEKSKVMFEDQQ